MSLEIVFLMSFKKGKAKYDNIAVRQTHKEVGFSFSFSAPACSLLTSTRTLLHCWMKSALLWLDIIISFGWLVRIQLGTKGNEYDKTT